MTTNRPDRTVLLITGDRAMQQRARRIIAAARHAVIECEPADASSHWADVDAVLVGTDRLAAMCALDPRRRDGVYVIAGDRVPDSAWRNCVALGVSDAVALDETEGWLVERLSVEHGGGQSGRVLCVRGAVGGAGATVVAAGLALAATDGPVVIIDTDLRGGWHDLLLGIEHDGLGWSQLAGLRGRVDGDALSATVPGAGEISLIAAERDREIPEVEPEALRTAVLAAAGLGGTVILDDDGSAALSATARQLADATIIVATSDLRGGLAARRALDATRDEQRLLGGGGPVVLAARTPAKGALPTRVFRDLIAPLEHCHWLREHRAVDSRVAKGLPGLQPRDRFVRDLGGLLERVVGLEPRRAA